KTRRRRWMCCTTWSRRPWMSCSEPRRWVLHYMGSTQVSRPLPQCEGGNTKFSAGQLQKVFTSLDYQSPGFDWGILRVALDTIEYLLGRIDQASEEHFSSEFDDN